VIEERPTLHDHLKLVITSFERGSICFLREERVETSELHISKTGLKQLQMLQDKKNIGMKTLPR